MILDVILQLQREAAKIQGLYNGSLTGLVCHSCSEAAAVPSDSREDGGSHAGRQAGMREQDGGERVEEVEEE